MLRLLNLCFDAGNGGAGSKKCATELIINFSNLLIFTKLTAERREFVRIMPRNERNDEMV